MKIVCKNLRCVVPYLWLVGTFFLVCGFKQQTSFRYFQNDSEIAKDVIYYVLVDRFANGSDENDYYQKGDPDAARHWPNTEEYGFPGDNIGNLSYDYAKFGQPKELVEWKKFWGGDLQGVIDSAAYFKKLEIGRVYMSSPVKQSETMPYYVDHSGTRYPYTAYHGFWPKDLYRIDEHFAGPTRWEDTPKGEEGGVEGWDVVKRLKQNLAQYDIGLMVDAVINHTNPVGLGYQFNDTQKGLLPAGYAGWGENGAVYENGQFVAAAGEYFVDGEKVEFADSNWFYNHRGSGNHAVNEMAFPGFGWAGLGDYNMTMKRSVHQSPRWEGWAQAEFDNPRPYEYVLNAYKKFIDEGFRAFRLDATKHVELPFLRRLSADLRAYASSTWGEDLYLVGEWYGAGFPAEKFGGENTYKFDAGGQPYGRFVDYVETNPTANIDFTLAWIIQEAFGQGHAFGNLSDYLQQKNAYFARHEHHLNANEQMIAFNNHDMPRFMQVARYYGHTYSESEAKKQHMLATIFLLTSQGVPMLFYGDDVFLYLDNPDRDHDQDPYNRPMMPKNPMALSEKDLMIGQQAKHIAALAKLRKKGSALAYGYTDILHTTADQLCYQRRHELEVVVVCINKSNHQVELSGIGASLANGSYHNHVSGVSEVRVRDGRLDSVLLGPFEAFVVSSSYAKDL